LDNILDENEYGIVKTPPEDPIGGLHIIVDEELDKYKLKVDIYLEPDEIEKIEVKQTIKKLLKGLDYT